MAFLGMRGTGEWPADYQPQDWREMVLYLYPNGMAPLTAIMSMLKSRQVYDPTYNWWTKGLPKQGGAVTAVWANPSLTTAYAPTAVAGTTVYAQMAAAVAEEFRVGHQAMLRKSGDNRYDTQGKVVEKQLAGANSWVAIKLTQAANATYDLTGVNEILIIGNINPEGAHMPDAIQYEAVKQDNVTQIFRTPLSLTRTALRTRLRTGDQYQEAKREALELHAMEMEKAFMWGRRYEGIGQNGKPERATQGLFNAIKDGHPAGVDNFTLNTTYTGQDWTVGGQNWLEDRLEYHSRYGNPDKFGLAGSGALRALSQLARANGQYQIGAETIEYGMKVTRFIHPTGSLTLKTAPLFSHQSANRTDIVIFEPEQLGFAYIDDTFFVEDPEDRRNRNNGKDAKEEEFITEAGLEWDHLETMGILSGVGLDNNLV